MSLRIISEQGELRAAQKQLVRDLSSQLPSLGRQWVTFRPTSAELTLHGLGAGRLYFGTRIIREQTKFWNAFGIFDPKRPKQEITVEINLALDGARTAGFLALDGTGRRFLMHSGGIGGGKAGVSQAAFIAWLNPELVAVEDEDGIIRHGIRIGELETSALAARIESFVLHVRAFKNAVANGLLDDPDFQARSKEWSDYLREFSGRKTGTVNAHLDYVSYHGDIVHALKHWLNSRAEPGDTVTNSRLIDLLVHADGKLKRIFEIKTSLSRQSLYAGIGQLLVHGCEPAVERRLVLPSDGKLPSDIEAALKPAGIGLVRYQINADDKVSIVSG